MFGKKKKRTTIGLDIGNRAIKVVMLETEGAKSKPRLKGYAVAATPAIAASLSEKVLGESVRQAVSDACPGERRVRAAVSGNTVVVRYIRMPAMALDELRSSIRYEAGQHIPFDVKEVELDCAILKPAGNGGGDGKMDVMLVAARKSACERLLNVVSAAGLTADCVDVDQVATINAFLLAKAGPDKPTALLNIGAKHSTVSIFEQETPAFSRCIEIGGEGLTLAIARGMGIEPDEAERLKVCGDALIEPHIEVVLNSIVRQTRSSFDYFEGLAGKPVDELYLSGGASLLNGLREFLSEALGVPTLEWDPCAGIDTSEFADGQELATVGASLDVAVGLAARSVEES